MKTTPFSVAVVMTVALGSMGPPNVQKADHPGAGTVKGSDHYGGEGRSPSPQDQVVHMLRSGPEGLELVVETLRKSSNARLKEAAAYVIGEYGKRELMPVLSDSLADSSEQVRRAATTALQKRVNPRALALNPEGDGRVLPPPESLPPNVGELCSALQPLLKDPSPLIRAPAAETVGWLRCNSSIADLQGLMRDPVEPVRFRASHALELLTGTRANFIDLDDVVWGRPPLMTVRKVGDASGAQQAGPFVRTAFFERQGKFSYRGGVPAQFQTVLQIGWAGGHLEFEAECQDAQPEEVGKDKLAFFLRPPGQSKLYKFEVVPGRGLVRQATETPEGYENETELHAHASVERNSREWKANLRIPFEAFGRHAVPVGEIWEANVVRTESHHSTGWGPEISSWTYFDRDSPGPPRLGNLYFAEDAPVLGFRPARENVYTFPFDQDSLPGDQTRPHQPADETLWGDIVAPDHLVKGMNTFFISAKLGRADPTPLRLTVVASGYEDRKVITSEVLPLSWRRQTAPQRVEVELPETIQSRAIDLEVMASGGDAQHALFRTCFMGVPVVSPPKVVTWYHLPKVEHEKGLWSANAGSSGEWTIRDYGPMLMSESYPMALLEGRNGTIYGGTYPGGRLFSFSPATGTLEDLGSPSPPANHLSALVASSDDRLYGDLYRPRGRVFSYNPQTRKSLDLGVPVAGAFSGECGVMAWADGRVYGTQRGHLFFAESATDRIVDKGSLFLNGKRYLPLQIAPDAKGNLLGVAGGRLFHYLPGRDEVRISNVELDGWLLPGPQGKLYTLFLDGRLFRWEPDKDELVKVSRYAPISLGEGPQYSRYRFRGILLVLTGTGELVVARSGIDHPEQTALWIYRPGGSPPINLGNPVSGSLYLTALTPGTKNTVYGMSTQTVYGLGRTPVHLYSLARVGRKTE